VGETGPIAVAAASLASVPFSIASKSLISPGDIEFDDKRI
jgi:hypothetical protein